MLKVYVHDFVMYDSLVDDPWERTSLSKLSTSSKLSSSLTYPFEALKAMIGVRGLDNLVGLWQLASEHAPIFLNSRINF